jgi:DNA-binding SARP family transcriptional activator/tetratricopeptide (TPR) repeat protein
VASDDLTVRVLGPVQLVRGNGSLVELPSASQRRLLGALALHAPRSVRTEWLCQVLDVTPGALRTLVARLRRVVGDGLLTTSVTGYRLDAPVDAALACRELERGRGDPTAIALVLHRWAGQALEEFADEPWAVGDAIRLGEIRSAAVEDLADALIGARRSDEAIAVLEAHLPTHPFRDRPRGLMVRALAAAGRPTEALRAYQEYHAFLAETAGTEPSAELRRIEQRVAGGWDGVAGPERLLTPVTTRNSPVLHEALAAATSQVGRREELAVLTGAASEARRRGPRIVLLSGEAGIGKTTLLAEFAREYCLPSGWNVQYGRCDESVTTPFQPFRTLLDRLVEELPDDVLAAHAARCGSDLVRLLPRLQTRMPAAAPTSSDEATARHLLFDAVVDVFRRAAAIAPLAVVLDDLHWAEPTALLLLRHVVRNLADVPVLIVASFRDSGDATDDQLRVALADLARGNATHLELRGLDPLELADLVHARVADVTGFDVGDVADRLRTETSGNPLYAEHLLRHWVSSHQLTVDEDVVTVASSTATDVPSSLRDLVWRRVAVLGPEAPPVLSAAAVLGVQFEERVLMAMVDVDDRDLIVLLDRAVAAGVLADVASPAGTIRFTHSLVARSMYAELGTRTRVRLHAEALRALLADQPTPSPELVPRLAHHAEHGGLLADALRWTTQAGDQALANLAPDEAAEWYRQALVHARALERPDHELADLLVRRGEAAYRAGRPTALDMLAEGAELARRCQAHATQVRAALATDRGSIRLGTFAPRQLAIVEAAADVVKDDDLVTRARVLALLAQSLVHTDQTERRTAAAYEALALANASHDPLVLARVAPDVLYALWAPGHSAVRTALALEATAIVDEAGDAQLAYVVYAAAYNVAVCSGDAVVAKRCLERARAVADEIGEPRMRWGVAVFDTFVATMAGRFADAERTVNGELELGMQMGEPDAFAMYATQSFVLGTFAGRHAELLPIVQHVIETEESIELPFRIAHAIVCCEVGRPEVATALLHEAMERGVDQIPADLIRSTSLIGYAILALELDDVAGAAWLYHEVTSMAHEVSFNGLTSQGPIAAYAGKLASLLGHYDAAEQYLLAALAINESFGWEYHRATTLIALAQNRVRSNHDLDPESELWLATAEQLCATHGITGWVRRAAAVREMATALDS